MAAEQLLKAQALEHLKATNPGLHARCQAVLSTRGTAPINQVVLEKLNEITWDAAAALIPTFDGKRLEGVRFELGLIAKACSDHGGDRSVLDVGCGDASLVPFLRHAGAKLNGYLGIDLSSRMLSIARRSEPALAFWQGSLLDDGFISSQHAQRRFGTVCFNNSLHLFADAEQAIGQAVRLLREQGPSRIVLAHYQGAANVREERRRTPQIVVSDMPPLAHLRRLAARWRLRILLPSALGISLPGMSDEAVLEKFYLVALEHA